MPEVKQLLQDLRGKVCYRNDPHNIEDRGKRNYRKRILGDKLRADYEKEQSLKIKQGQMRIMYVLVIYYMAVILLR